MADDKSGGDDLFEDLDKFFAPIRDVDWESDEPVTSTPEAPREEHVAVRPSETPEQPASEPTAGAPSDAVAGEEEDEEAWYDTGVLEPIDELLGEPVIEGESELPEEEAPIVIEEAPAAPDDEAELFEPEDEEEDRGATAELAPSDEEMEAAAEHFASSVHIEDEGEPTERVVAMDEGETGPIGGLFGEEDAGEIEEDILADLDEEGARRTVVVGAEGFGGPSWQEPTSVEVGADLDRRGPGEGERDVPAAFLTGIILAGVALGSLLVGKGMFVAIAAILVLIAQGELFGAVAKHHHQPATLVGLVTGALMIAGAYYHGEPGILAMLALGVIATLLWFLAAPMAHRRGTLTNIGLTLMNLVYIPLLGSYLIVTLAIGGSDGKALVVAVIGLTFIFDTAAFLVGSVWGGSFFDRPLAPNTSPKKSIEGLIGATLVTVIVSMALVPSFVGFFENKRIEALALAIVVAAAATLGDLAESLIKRDLGIKDMGSLLPGHGGVLDRIDSLLFVAPAAFLLFRVIFA